MHKIRSGSVAGTNFGDLVRFPGVCRAAKVNQSCGNLTRKTAFLLETYHRFDSLARAGQQPCRGWTAPCAESCKRKTGETKVMAIASQASARALATDATRWGQLIFGIICMVMIANLQYGWTLFVGPIDSKYHWGRAAIQVAFTIFVLTETWLVPIEGYLIDKFGPRIMISGSGVLVAIAWIINSFAD